MARRAARSKRRTTRQPTPGRAAQAGTALRFGPSRSRGRSSIVGGSGSLITAGFVTQNEFNADVRGTRWYGESWKPGIVHQMLRDPHVRASLEFIINPLCGAVWQFRPSSPEPTPLDLEIADFCQWAFVEHLIDFYGVLRASMRSALSDGFSFHEMTDDLRPIPATRFPNHPGGGQGILPTGMYHRPGWTFHRFYQRKKNPLQLERVEQWLQGSDVENAGPVEVPADRLLRWTYDQDGSDFTGVPPLRAAYQPWKLKIAFQILRGIRHERYAVGTPVLYTSEDAADADLDAAESIMAEMRSHEKGYAIFPHGYKFEWSGMSSSDSTNIDETIKLLDDDIAWNVLAGHMRLGQGQTGSYALATTQQGVFHTAIQGYARFWANTWNRGVDGWSPIERIVSLNYGNDAPLPKLVPVNLPTHDWKALIPEINNSILSGAIRADDKLEAQVREMLGLAQADTSSTRIIPPGRFFGEAIDMAGRIPEGGETDDDERDGSPGE